MSAPAEKRALRWICLCHYARRVRTDDSQDKSPPVLHDFAPAIEIDLEPVDSVRVTTLMDNVTDPLRPDQGPARRVPLTVEPRKAATAMDDGEVPDSLIAEHGFSVLVTVSTGDREYRFAL